MRVLRTGVLLLIVALMVLPGCNPFRRSRIPKTPQVPAPTPPAAESKGEAKGESVTPKQLELPEPPHVEQPPLTSIPDPPLQTESPPTPPPVQQPSRSSQSATPKPEPEQAVESETSIPVPQLKQLLTPTQERQYNQEINESLRRVQNNLAILRGRSLGDEQLEVIERIYAFLQQTTETRKVDLLTARSLAERADLLAQNLERTTR